MPTRSGSFYFGSIRSDFGHLDDLGGLGLLRLRLGFRLRQGVAVSCQPDLNETEESRCQEAVQRQQRDAHPVHQVDEDTAEGEGEGKVLQSIQRMKGAQQPFQNQ